MTTTAASGLAPGRGGGGAEYGIMRGMKSENPEEVARA